MTAIYVKIKNFKEDCRMLHMGRLEKILRLFYHGIFIIVLANILMRFSHHITGLSTILYCFFIIVWASAVEWSTFQELFAMILCKKVN